MYISKSHVLYGIVSLFSIFFVTPTQSMESATSNKLFFIDPIEASKLIFIKTSDNNIVTIEKWKAIQLSHIKEQLNKQTIANSKENPVDVSALKITKDGLQSISHYFDMISEGNFDEFIVNKFNTFFSWVIEMKNKLPEKQILEEVEKKNVEMKIMGENLENLKEKGITAIINFYSRITLIRYENKYENTKNDENIIKKWPKSKNFQLIDWKFLTIYDGLKELLAENFPDNVQKDIKDLNYEQLVLVYELLCSKVAGVKRYFSTNDPKMEIYTSLPDSIKTLLPLSSWWQSFYSRQRQNLKYGLGILGLGALIGAYYTQQQQ